MRGPQLSSLKTPLGILTLAFVLFFSLFSFFQVLFFKYYLDTSLESKVENTLNQVGGKLSDYLRFIEEFYEISFIPELAELPESKGWLLELVDSLEDFFRKEKFLSLAIFYQKKPFLTWNYEDEKIPFEKCENKLKMTQKENLLKAFKKVTLFENREFCIFLTLDISYYQNLFERYILLTGLIYFLTLGMVLFLLFRFLEAEEKKREAEKRLQAERELALLGRMAATLAHELRNSLNNLFLLLQSSPSQQETSLQKKILDEVKGLLNWTQEILLFHRELTLNPTYFDPEDLLFEIKLTIAHSGKEIAFSVDKRVERLWGDPFWIKKALENLVKNSLQAIKEKGHLKISLEKKNDFYIIEVYDDGEPIPQELLDKIFEPFFSTKKEGFGLGLFLVKKIMEAHRGKVEIENQPEGGKIFRLIWREGT